MGDEATVPSTSPTHLPGIRCWIYRSDFEEIGFFSCLGAYSKDAQHISRTRQDLRLINGNELVDLIFQHYAQFSPNYKQLLPMRSVYVIDREPRDAT
jgi:restriction system protein